MKRAAGTTLPPWRLKKVLGAVQPLRGQEEDVAAEPLRQRAIAEVADDEADVVADHGGEKHHGDVHLTGACEHRGGDQHDFPWHRHAEVLEEQHPGHSEVSVPLEQRLHVGENTRQLGVGHGCNRKFTRPDFDRRHAPGRIGVGGEYSFAAVSSSRWP